MKTKLILLVTTMLVSFAGFAQAQADTAKAATEKAKCPAGCTKECCTKKKMQDRL